MKTYEYADYVKAAEIIKEKIKTPIELALVLGSGLGGLADEVKHPLIIDYRDLPGWPLSTVEGHKGRLVIGELAGRMVLVQQGRVHFYEGYSPAEITFPIRVMQCLKIPSLIVTNAAGGVNPSFSAGDVMLITDHIGFVSMSGFNPLNGRNFDQFGPRFPDMSQAYDREYGSLVRKAATRTGIDLKEGVYTWLSGPSFETPAEIRFLRTVGTDAVGMSTVPEVIVARHGGMRVLGLSGITNKCSDDGEMKADHQEVLQIADIIGPKIIRILYEILPDM
ncbi:MAG TPA: purine-nucleoside phosphorylase [Flexilinea sp.]|nr:purine-nucleoside phosphorylase [Flexilinea sp.]HOP00810.1 purine-nucleoside phosphorylase [Flexilinea sp.]HPJ65932.1 purine-nucleoside phosphorylase [Flexilinea sp.]HPL57187.1 purine-nucleoside phosphorylase [Flexilinea sp.]HPR69953.1 purine-nucleoside phosphorylase [Flexilinea sp.]